MMKTAPHAGSALRQFYIEADLKSGTTLTLPHALARRFKKVLRLQPGQEIGLFNGKDGLVHAVLKEDAQSVTLTQQLKEMPETAKVTAFIGLPKRETMDRVLRQLTELNVIEIQPLLMDYSVPDRLNTERAHAILVEAAEQCERLSLPTLRQPITLQQAIETYKDPVFWAHERSNARQCVAPAHAYAVLVGPEGGFSPTEQEFLTTQSHVTPVSLGATILRVDTAVVAIIGRMGVL